MVAANSLALLPEVRAFRNKVFWKRFVLEAVSRSKARGKKVSNTRSMDQ